jgi:hypothetical protein
LLVESQQEGDEGAVEVLQVEEGAARVRDRDALSKEHAGPQHFVFALKVNLHGLSPQLKAFRVTHHGVEVMAVDLQDNVALFAAERVR